MPHSQGRPFRGHPHPRRWPQLRTLERGLPDGPAYDLVYRHGLDIDPSGERLAMGSTTGGLWLSENGGEDWQQLSANLPPIYCVRFA